MNMPEEEAFSVLIYLMCEHRLRELFKPGMAELGTCLYQLEYLIQVRTVCMYAHLSRSMTTSFINVSTCRSTHLVFISISKLRVFIHPCMPVAGSSLCLLLSCLYNSVRGSWISSFLRLACIVYFILCVKIPYRSML